MYHLISSITPTALVIVSVIIAAIVAWFRGTIKAGIGLSSPGIDSFVVIIGVVFVHFVPIYLILVLIKFVILQIIK
jgi:hypothetical protein